MYGLNIHLKSFKLNPKIIGVNDKVRVSITTFPENNKEAFITEGKQMSFVHHFFTVNVTDQTDKIVIVFRRHGFFDDPIVGSTTISCKDFATKDYENVEMKTMNIYEPLQSQGKKRRAIGEMEIQFHSRVHSQHSKQATRTTTNKIARSKHIARTTSTQRSTTIMQNIVRQ
ncbi:hypothetical protein M9Y10_017934 [Tritrichomonas musculus]|uniref:C2 NT-type domain-containing protein n=1 Tax=Tritrichomonas musculus TaxID=1915356 RepID=A0ABR2HWH2_9EUKA